MKLLSTTQMRRQKLEKEYSVSVPGPCPGSRYYPVPDGTPYAKTLVEIQAAFDALRDEQRQREAARRMEQVGRRAGLERRMAEALVKREEEAAAAAAAHTAERSRVRKLHAAEQDDLTRRRAEGSYAGPVTLREAYSHGWQDEEPEHYAGERMLLKGHTLARGTKSAVSRTEWGRCGSVVKDGESAHAVVVKEYGNRYEVFRHDQVEQKRLPSRKACIALLTDQPETDR